MGRAFKRHGERIRATFTPVEERLLRSAREQLAAGRRHLFEAEMKESERTRGEPGHEATPDQV